jgi:putative tryptophan/tyrosine transport system substrate-binding protein
MMRRHMGVIVTLVLISLVGPLAVKAQPATKVPRIGVLWAGSPPSAPDWKQHSTLLQELRHLGWREGENLSVEFRWAAGRYRHGADLAAELVRLPVDVLVVDSEPLIVAAQRATTTIPIVMISVDDPVEMGFIASLARPSGNITGIDNSFVLPLSMKLLELLKETVPTVNRIAVLAQQTTPATWRLLEDLKPAARALGVQLHVLAVSGPHEFERVFATATQEGAGALLILPALRFTLHQSQLAALAATHRLPTIYWRRSFVEAGGLLSYGPKVSDLTRRVAHYVDRILKGAKPADLPVERPTTFELVINLKTAQALGLTIPPSLLFQANEVLR